jgi:hypothetical protein
MVWELIVVHLIKSYKLCAMHLTTFCHLWIIKSCVQPVVIAGVVKKIVCVNAFIWSQSRSYSGLRVGRKDKARCERGRTWKIELEKSVAR